MKKDIEYVTDQIVLKKVEEYSYTKPETNESDDQKILSERKQMIVDILADRYLNLSKNVISKNVDLMCQYIERKMPEYGKRIMPLREIDTFDITGTILTVKKIEIIIESMYPNIRFSLLTDAHHKLLNILNREVKNIYSNVK